MLRIFSFLFILPVLIDCSFLGFDLINFKFGLDKNVNDEFPFVVSIAYKSYPFLIILPSIVHRCTGIILNQRWVLSSCRCYSEEDIKNDFVILYGNSNYTELYQDKNYIRVEQIIKHPKCDSKQDQNLSIDLAVLKLEQKLPLTYLINNACFLNFRRYTSNSNFTAIGWQIQNPTSSKYLQKKQFAYLECENNEDKLICVRPIATSAKSSYKEGDNYAILNHEELGKKYVVGLNLNQESYESRYTRLSTHLDWILNTTNYYICRSNL